MPDTGDPGGAGLDALLKATARGELGAFELLYDRLSGPVYHLIRSVLRDRAQAEEVAQEVFLEIWQQAARYDAAKGTVTAWVMTVARRRAIDRVRSAAAAAARERQSAMTPSPYQAGEADEDAMERDELLRRCLAGLTGLQREAIMLAFYGEHTHSQVATVLGVPLGTAKTRIRDGLARLRGAMLDGAQEIGAIAGVQRATWGEVRLTDPGPPQMPVIP